MLKLPEHDRYHYVPITQRPHYAWPGGKRLAFYIALNIEHFAFQTGRGMDPHDRSGRQSTRNWAWRDYGNRVGNWRLFEMLDELKLPASILLNSTVCTEYPEIIAAMAAPMRKRRIPSRGRRMNAAPSRNAPTSLPDMSAFARQAGWGRARSNRGSPPTC